MKNTLIGLLFLSLLASVVLAESNVTIIYPSNTTYTSNITIDLNYTYSYNDTASPECIAEINGYNHTIANCRNTSLTYVYNQSNDLLFSTDLSDGGGSTVHDRSIYGINSTVYARWVSGGRFGYALNFSFFNESWNLSAASQFNMSVSSGMTLEAWVNINNYTGGQEFLIMGKVSNVDASTGYALLWNFDNNGFGCGKIGVTTVWTATHSALGSWYHIACIINSSGMFLWVNGILNNSNANTVAITNVAAPFQIGHYSAGATSRFSNMTIDEIAIYNRSLRSDEIIRHYQNNNTLPIGTNTVQVRINSTSATWNASGTTTFTMTTGAPVIRSVTVNETYSNSNHTIRIRANVTDFDGTADISQVNMTIFMPDGTVNQSSRMFAAGTDMWEFNYTTNATEGNYSVEINANDTSSRLATRINSSFIVDTTRPVLFLNRSDNGILLGHGVNLTFNFEDIYINTTVAANMIYFFNSDDTLSFQRNITTNTTYEFNSSASGQSWNYTLNITIRDLAGNTNSTTLEVGFGKINISVQSRITALNYTGADNSLGENSPIQNNTFWNITLGNINITITSDGELASRTNRSQINLTRIVGNWTNPSIILRNRTGGTVAFLNHTDLINFSTNSMSTGSTDSFAITLDAINTLNFSIHKASSGFYYYMVSNNSDSFSEFVTVSLPASEVFSASSTHPRYFICTDITRSNPPTCNSFTPGVDVTSVNNGDNGISGYTVNMKVKSTGSAINNLTYKANHTDSLVQIIMVAGAFVSGSGGGTSVSGGGGGGAVYIPIANASTKPSCGYSDTSRGICCPPGYTIYNNQTSLCERPPSPLAGFEFSILQKEIFMGLNVFHGIIILGTIAILTRQRKKLSFLKRQR